MGFRTLVATFRATVPADGNAHSNADAAALLRLLDMPALILYARRTLMWPTHRV